ncbi:MAG: sulfite exporter TauE/SafE family protein [Gammaproteobacteria bacterium]|nr:sulfite exporter TauE/SafE family protein [Gammaproteobacteria bacterium]MCW8987945.1 sulfite exporter TauE/SafE family protein [Gammaproteobacteria bacterium]
MLELFISYIGLGVIAGFVAGLLGVGGGLIIVPALILIFQSNHFDHAVIVHMAIGTSLATIIFTSLSSIYAHHVTHKAVRWDIVKKLTPGIIVGALFGAIIADYISAKILQQFFGFFELFVAFQMALNIKPHASRSLPGYTGIITAATGIGTISSIVGIGGGTLTVPFLVWCNIKIQQAVATSSACGLPIAVAGCVGFVITGWNESNLPEHSLGYVYWPAFITIVISSVLLAPLGAWLAHRLSAAKLKRYFSLVLFILGLKMLFS